MDIEEFKKMLETDAGRALLAPFIETATSGLVTKNAELLAELKTARGKQNGASEEELAELQRKAKIADDLEQKNLESKGEYETLLAKSREQHAKETEKLTTRAEKAEAATKKLLVEGGLTSALTEANTNPALLQAAVKLLADDIQVIEVDGEMKGMVGDKSMVDYVKEWADGDVGKNFVLAPSNSGGQEQHGDGSRNKGGASDSEKFFDPASPHYNLTEQVKLNTSNPEEYKRLAEKFGTGVRQPNAAQIGMR